MKIERLSAVPIWICCVAASSASLYADVDFNRDVRPILADNCFECHGPDEESREADLRLDVLDDAIGWVIEPGNPANSEMFRRMISEEADEVMPPPESKRRPTPKQIETLRKWIEQDAPYEQHWAFVSPSRPELPRVSESSWPLNPIDAFVKSRLESELLVPRPDAPPRVLARRLSFALTGLPVMPDTADRFAEEYSRNSQVAVSMFVDELLASPAYGEHQAWVWMDAARYADTNGYQADGFRVMWPWRDWLIRSLNANMPLDQMTQQMLAGDLMIPKAGRDWESADWIADDASSELLTATGFLRNHRYDTGSGTIPAESKFENAVDRMETVGTVWMGLTLLCARCHTHKYDPIENHEYYGLLSFFDNVREAGSALKGASHPYIHTPTAEGRTELKRLQAALEQADAAFRAAEPKLVEAQGIWDAKLSKLASRPTREASAFGSRGKEHHARVLRGLQFRYAEEPIHFDGAKSIEESNDPIALARATVAGRSRFGSDPNPKETVRFFRASRNLSATDKAFKPIGSAERFVCDTFADGSTVTSNTNRVTI